MGSAKFALGFEKLAFLRASKPPGSPKRHFVLHLASLGLKASRTLGFEPRCHEAPTGR